MRVLLLLLCLCFPLASQTLLIRNVTVIDATGAAPRVANVVVSSGRIVSVGKAAKARRVIEGRGKFLIPGLWDMHVHLWESEPLFRLYIANGVLGIRDMGSNLEQTRAWSKHPLAPRIYTSGPAIDGGSPYPDLKFRPFIATTTADTMR